MKITVKVGVICAAVWISIKLILFALGMTDNLVASIMLNTFLLLCAICIGLYLLKSKEQESNTLTDIKNGLSAAMPYTVLLSAFMYVYYDSIDADFLSHRRSERMTAVTKSIEGNQWEEFKKENPNFETMTREEYLKQQEDSQNMFLSAKSVALLNLLGGLVLGTFYSIFVTVIYRKFIFRT